MKYGAVCVVGQTSRLEIDSKLKNIVQPNLNLGISMYLLMVLSTGTHRYVNANSKRLSESKFASYNAFNISTYVKNRLPNANVDTQIFNTHAMKGDEIWVKKYDKKFFGLPFNHRRQHMHLQQWNMIRQCAFSMDRIEQQKSITFGSMLKIRDDTISLTPWHISLNIDGIETVNMLEWGGYMDATFLISRKHVWSIMEGLIAEWYISHLILKAPHNPEKWLKNIVEFKNVSHKHVSFCHMPFVSARFVDNKIFMKPHHYVALNILRSTLPCLNDKRLYIPSKCPKHICET
jgi:hypothetical protein